MGILYGTGPHAGQKAWVHPGIIGYALAVYPIRWIRPEYILDVYPHQSSHGPWAAKPLKTCVDIVTVFPVDGKLNWNILRNYIHVTPICTLSVATFSVLGFGSR